MPCRHAACGPWTGVDTILVQYSTKTEGIAPGEMSSYSMLVALALVCGVVSLPNVLYILSDDMRADIGAYGLPTATPNIDALASSGLRFLHSFCQISVCSPSRQSFLTGRRPDRSGVWNFIDANPLNVTALPRHFRDAGYLTIGAGKTFHEDSGAWNAPNVWSNSSQGKPWYFDYSSNECPHGGEGGGQCILSPQEELALFDHVLLNTSLSYLAEAIANRNASGQPFFFMTGFRDPHAPWAAPQRMYDLYNESAIDGPAFPVLGNGTPLIAWSNELTVMLANGTTFPFSYNKSVPSWVQRNQRHAYYAAVSYVDEHVGALLNVVHNAGLDEETIVVFHSDHGYILGEHGYWEKKANFDLTVRVPLIVRVPGKPASAGAVTASYFDLVDLFPTLSSLAGLPPPPADTDGTDYSSLFDDPTQMLKTEAFHQFPACGMTAFNMTRQECNQVPSNQFNFMGYSIRNPDWRYTRWLEWDTTTLTSKWDGAFVDELYAHTGDNSTNMDEWENLNVAVENPDIVAQLSARLRTFFDHAW
jgi:iduronate 2-sulfatase